MPRTEDADEDDKIKQNEIEGWKDIVAMIIAVLLNLLPLFIFMIVLLVIFVILQFIY